MTMMGTIKVTNVLWQILISLIISLHVLQIYDRERAFCCANSCSSFSWRTQDKNCINHGGRKNCQKNCVRHPFAKCRPKLIPIFCFVFFVPQLAYLRIWATMLLLPLFLVVAHYKLSHSSKPQISLICKLPSQFSTTEPVAVFPQFRVFIINFGSLGLRLLNTLRY